MFLHAQTVLCLFYGLCVFTIVFSLFWMALPKLRCPKPAGETNPPSPLSLAAQAVPRRTARYCLRHGGRWPCTLPRRRHPGALIRVTGIYTNLLPENDACASSAARGHSPGNWTCCWKIWGNKCNEPLHDVQRLIAFI